MFKNLSFYINQDINFYEYYVNNKKKEDLLLNESKNSFNNNNEEASFRINEDSFSVDNINNPETLEENIMKGFDSNFMKNLLNSNEKKIKKKISKNYKSIENKNEITIKDIFENDSRFFIKMKKSKK